MADLVVSPPVAKRTQDGSTVEQRIEREQLGATQTVTEPAGPLAGCTYSTGAYREKYRTEVLKSSSLHGRDTSSLTVYQQERVVSETTFACNGQDIGTERKQIVSGPMVRLEAHSNSQQYVETMQSRQSKIALGLGVGARFAPGAQVAMPAMDVGTVAVSAATGRQIAPPTQRAAGAIARVIPGKPKEERLPEVEAAKERHESLLAASEPKKSGD